MARRLLKIFKKTKTVAIRVGDGRTIHSLGGVDVTICLGDETVTQHCRVLDTNAFDIVIGTDFLRRNPHVKMLSLQRPYSLHCDFGSGLFSVPLELSGRKKSGLRYASKTNYRTENYQLARHVLENGLAVLQVNLDEIKVELFASQQQQIMQLYCSKQLNNAFRTFWKALGLAYANPPFSLLAKVLTKIAYEGGRVVMCTPDGSCSDEHAYWRRMLDRMTVGRVQLPDGPIYVPEDSDTAMQAPEWAEGIERQERLQYLRQTWKSSIWSEEDDDSCTLPDPEIPLVYSLHYGQQCPPEWDDGSVPAETADRQKKKEHGKSNLHAEEDFLQKLESLNLDPRLTKLLITDEEVFGALPPPLSCKKLVQMDLKLKPEFEKTRVRRRPYPAPQEQVEEIDRQIQECIDAGLFEEYKQGNYPHHCSPCFLVAKPGLTALRLVVDYGEVNKKAKNHSGSIPNMENTLERIAKCRHKTKMDKRSAFWQVDLTAAAQELLAFITPKGCVFKWKVMPFGVANAPALFQELMIKFLYILRRRPLVQELISRGAEMEAHIDDVSLGTNTKEDHVLLIVCQKHHLRIKLEKCEFMKEEMDYLGFDVGYGW